MNGTIITFFLLSNKENVIMRFEVISMLDYLNQALGLKAKISPWTDAAQLPLYLRNGKKYSLLRIDDVECLLIEVDENNFSLPSFRKQMDKLPAEPEYIVLCFRHLDSRRRKALIEAKTSFIVPDSQIYLPFLGIVLQERMKLVRSAPKKLSAAAQLILLHLLYEPAGWVSTKVDLARRLNISAMNVTRSIQELLALELVTVKKSGRCDYVSVADAGKSLYEKALPYMIDPVQKRLYVCKREEFDKLPLAGEYALATKSVLNEPTIECKAISRKEYKVLAGIEEVDPAWSSSRNYIQLELWKYDPSIFANYHCVDVVSLALSLRENKDERIEQAIEEMLEEYKW